MPKKRFAFLLAVIFAGLSAEAAAAGPMVAFEPGPGRLKLVTGGRAADILVDPADHRVVSIAAEDLADDLERVTGARPALKNTVAGLSAHAVIIGTLGRSAAVDALAASGRLDVSRVRGQWETYVLAVVESPLPGVDRALVIAGSDRRGTAFGCYEVSRAIGVSPWVWWADSAPRRHPELYVNPGPLVFGPPSVKYRGIFLNDEDYGLQPWAAKTFDRTLGDIGPRTYERVFELLLRLRANHIWPAMHDVTHAFNYYPESRRIADDYAIVMGSSHCEQMLRNNVDEWKRDGRGPWMYQFNRDNVLAYWEARVRENGKYENIYTLGMRGIHDSPIVAIGSRRQVMALTERIFAEQRKLLAKWVNPDVTQVPQVLVPYNEVLGYLDDGLQVPEDVTIMWVDDNNGYIRRLYGPDERRRSGSSGVYYHVSYKGPPHDYLWLCSTPPALVWEEMTRAYAHGADRIWMANVGDLKPAEIDMEFFLDLGWDVKRFGSDAQPSFLREFAAREFGPELAPEIAGILDRYFTLSYQRRPEHMGVNAKGAGVSVGDSPFSLDNYDEAGRRLAEFAAIEERASAVMNSLPPEERDSFFQLVLYPVRASAAMNRKVISAQRSRALARQGVAGADREAAAAAEAFAAIQRETDVYDRLAGGKWRLMMNAAPYDREVFKMPPVGKDSPQAAGAPRAVAASTPPLPAAEPGTFVEVGGAIAIDAGHFARVRPGASGAVWTLVSGLGRSGAAMVVLPFDAPVAAPASATVAEYPLLVTSPGRATLIVHALPVWPVVAGRRSVVLVGVDDGPPVEVDLDGDGLVFKGPAWYEAVLSAVMYGRVEINLTAGSHTLRVYGIDPSAVIDRIVIDLGGLKPSYLGPPESVIR